jgi:hypothetical protein
MDRDEVDRDLVGLTAAYDRISAAMFALDGHAGLAALRGAGLTGDTRHIATEVLARADLLWSHYAALRSHLERAKAIRAERSRPGDDELVALTGLLRGPAIGLDAAGMALDETSPGPPVQRVALPQLTQNLERGAGETLGLLDEVRAAGDRMAARFVPLTGALAAARAERATLGGEAPGGAELDRVESELTLAHRDAAADPLSTGSTVAALEARLRDLAARVSAVGALLAEVAGVRDGFPARADRLKSTVDELAAAREAAGRAYATVLEKIADPGLPGLPEPATALRAHLDQLRQLHAEARWTRLGTELAAAEQAAAAGLTRLTELRGAADGLMERRDELRGRLEAYRARAGRLGFIEHSGLSAAHEAAQRLLYTQPCDLPAATRAVVAYQRQLNDLSEREPQQ